MYVMQIIRHWAVGVLLLLNSVTTYFKIWTTDIDFFFFFTSWVHCPSM